MIYAYPFIAAYALWLFYLAVMNLKRARDAGALTSVAYAFGLPLMWIGLVLDVVANVLIMTLLMLELPREWTVTARLSRHARGGGWRQAIALWMALHLLDTFDPSGKHIK